VLHERTRAWLLEITGGDVARVEQVQSLWSGYGAILRVHLRGGSLPSVIVKQIAPPDDAQHPRGWSGATSHARKLRSYEVERCFYRDWCAAPDDAFRTARCYGATTTDDGQCLLLEDLDAAGYAGRRAQLDGHELARCLDWLAALHARFVGKRPDGLWPVGTYWHLATRQDELLAMQDDELRDAAAALDEQLNTCRFQTIVHGDAKAANFCFGHEGVAAVDFQYAGGGCGIKDVAYLLSSCLDDAQCERHADRHVDTYFAALRARLPAHVDAGALEREWRGLYAAAWADFHRFLDGWAPDHWKIHRYTREMTRRALG